MSFEPDVERMKKMATLSKVLKPLIKRCSRTVAPLAVLSSRKTLETLFRNYTFAFRDALATVEAVRHHSYWIDDATLRARIAAEEDCNEDFPLILDIQSLIDTVRAHGTVAAVCCSGTLMRIACELDTRFTTFIRPLAEEAVRNLQMLYDDSFAYRAPMFDEAARKPIVRLETAFSSLHDMKTFSRNLVPTDGCRTLLVRRALPGPFCRYIQGRYFGPSTRRSRLVTFRFVDKTIRACRYARGVVERSNMFLVAKAPITDDPARGELVSKERHSLNFEVVCEEVPTDESITRISLAAGSWLYKTIRGIQVMEVAWIDAGHILNNSLLTASSIHNRFRRGFPYDKRLNYLTWHVVMGNGCRIKVRVSTTEDVRGCEHDTHPRWTLTNTDNHPGFNESAHLLLRYYSFQAESEKVICPLSPSTINAFIASKPGLRLHLLYRAHVETPSATGTPATRSASRQTQQLIHAMVLKHLGLSRKVMYMRLKSIKR